MPGPMFIHLQTYARKSNPGGQSVDQVIAEGRRDPEFPEFSAHVDMPREPRILLGDPGTFRATHAAHVDARGVDVRTKRGPARRAIRVDRHTLATMVASYPVAWDQLDALPNGRDRLADWERRTIAWAQDRWGDQLRVAIAHDDEAHPHLHLWMLPNDPSADATTLHPGKVAKSTAESVAKKAGISAREAVAFGNEALKAAMVDLLDDYWHGVGVPCGMTRDGPKRARLTRSQDRARKAELGRMREAHLVIERVGDDARSVIDAAEIQADQVRESAESDAQAIREVARAEGLAEGRADAAVELREIRRELHDVRRELTDVRRGFLAWLRESVDPSLHREGAGWVQRLDGLLDRLRAMVVGSGAGGFRQPVHEPPQDDDPSPSPGLT